MSSVKPLLVVLGATGNQGGSVISHFLSLSPQPYALRTVTRDPTSTKALALASQGVEVVAGDFDDPPSLDIAFRNATAIYTVTDFIPYLLNPDLRKKAVAAGIPLGIYFRDYEAQQNKNIIDAAAKVSTLERFIFSSLPNMGKLSGGKYPHVYFSDSKAIAEEYGEATYPALWAKTSVFIPGFFFENLVGPNGAAFLPKSDKKTDSLIAPSIPPLTTSVFPWYSVREDTGPFVAALLQSAPGKRVIGGNGWLSMEDVSKLLAQSLGKELKFENKMPDLDVGGDPDFKIFREELMAFAIEFGYYGEKVDNSVLKPDEIGVEVKLQQARKWFEKQDWEKVLGRE